MEIKDYISRMKTFYSAFIHFAENHTTNDFQDFISFIQDNHFGENPDEFRSMLHVIHKVFGHHKQNLVFTGKIYRILLHFSDKIKQTFSNNDIFRIFRNNKLILSFLFENNIIDVNENIVQLIFDKYGPNDSNFFYPELKPFYDDGKIKLINQLDLTIEDYIKKRKEGVNDSYVCQLIRNDLIDEFKKFYDEQKSIEIFLSLPKSLFETNTFLNRNEPSFIEYAAYYGAMKIFNYLNEQEEVELTSSLWNYAINGHNTELIELLKEKQIEPEDESYDECFIESVKCHHNDIAKKFNKKIDAKKLSYLCYYNFDFIPLDFGDDYESILDLACQYDYVEIVKILLKSGKIQLRELLESKSISNEIFSLKPNQEIINFLLKELGTTIESFYFQRFGYIRQLEIPSFITKIEGYSFLSCPSLARVKIPSSVTFIGDFAFSRCKSLVEATIPSSVTEIGIRVFCKCAKLKGVTISPSMTRIPNGTFEYCSSLLYVIIPSSVTEICDYAFCSCSNLKSIMIPSSVTVIGDYAFCLCSNLNQIEIPFSVKKIANYLFRGCSELRKINISTNITEIGKYAFHQCKSLNEIFIPPNVKSIGEFAFSECKSLESISIPSSIVDIDKLDLNDKTKIIRT